MATKTNSKKTTKKAEINLPSLSNKQKKKGKKEIDKTLKNLSIKHIIIAVILLVFGGCIGIGAYFAVCRNDCFELIGEDELTFIVGEFYIDEGAKVVEFNKDISKTIYIETNMQQDNNKFYATEVGTYYIKYLTPSLKFGKIFKVTKIRLITFVEQSEDNE